MTPTLLGSAYLHGCIYADVVVFVGAVARRFGYFGRSRANSKSSYVLD